MVQMVVLLVVVVLHMLVGQDLFQAELAVQDKATMVALVIITILQMVIAQAAVVVLVLLEQVLLVHKVEAVVMVLHHQLQVPL
jgi:hypothetical protein